MSVKIPQRRFSLEAPNLSVAVPKVVTPPRAAFGGQIQEAAAYGVKAIADPIQKRLQDRADLEKKQRANAIEVAFKNDLDNQLLSTREISQVRDGKKVSVPEGYLNRRGLFANGSSDEMINNNKQKMQQYLGQFNDPLERAEMQSKFQDYFRGRLNDVVRHQVGEDKKYKNEQSVAYRSRIAQEAALPNANLADIMRRMDSDTDVLANYNGTSPEVVELEKQANSVEVLKNYMPTSFLQDASGASMLVTIKQYEPILGPDGSKELKKLVDTTKKEAKQALETEKVSNTMTTIDQIINGQFDWSEEGVLSTEGKTVDGFSEALMKNIKTPNKIGNKKSDEIYIARLNNIFNSKNDVDMTNNVTQIIDDYSGTEEDKIEMAMLIKVAKEKAGDRDYSTQLRSVIKSAVDNGLNGTEIGKDYIEAVESGLKPTEARDQVLSAYGLGESADKDNLFAPSATMSKAENKGGFFSSVAKGYLDYNANFAKGLAGMVASTPQAMGALVKEYGESMEENSNFWKDVIRSPMELGVHIANLIPSVREKNKRAKEPFIAIGQNMIDSNREWILKSGLTRPEAQGLNQIAFDLGSGTGSLGLSVGTALITKNPFASAALFGTLQKGRIYEEARQAGLTPVDASTKSNLAGAIEGGVELVGLNWILKNFGGRIMNAVSKSFGEGLTEGIQTISEDQIADWRNKGGVEKFQDAAYSMALGFMLGGGVSTVLDMSNHKDSIKELEKAGFSTEQAEDIIVKTAQGTIEEINAVSDEIDVELARFDSEGGGQEQAQPKVKEQKIHSALQPLAERTKNFETAEEFAAAIVPSKKQVLARKFFMDFYNQVTGVKTPVVDAEGVVTATKTAEGATTAKESTGEPVQVTGGKVTQLESEQGRLKPVGTGKKKVSRLAERMVNTLEAIPEAERVRVPEYKEMSNKEQITRASEFVSNTSNEDILQIFEGKKKLPEGLTYGGVFVAMSEKLQEEGDVTTASELVDLQTRTGTRFGQEIEILKEVDQLNPMKYITQLHRAKVESAKGEEGGNVKKVRQKVAKESQGIKEELVKSRPKKGDWVAFVAQLRC